MNCLDPTTVFVPPLKPHSQAPTGCSSSKHVPESPIKFYLQYSRAPQPLIPNFLTFLLYTSSKAFKPHGTFIKAATLVVHTNNLRQVRTGTKSMGCIKGIYKEKTRQSKVGLSASWRGRKLGSCLIHMASCISRPNLASKSLEESWYCVYLGRPKKMSLRAASVMDTGKCTLFLRSSHTGSCSCYPR